MPLSKLAGLVLAFILLLPIITLSQRPRFSSRYKNPQAGGLYLVESSNADDHRALVLSTNNKPIEPKANQPDAPTVPGYYLSYTKRLAFEKVEVIGKRVYFKTRPVGGISYEFRGRAGKEIDPNFDDTTPIPFIKGTLTKLKNGKIIRSERVKFGHAVIA